MGFEEELDILLRARFTLIVLVTPEEERALEAIKAVCQRGKRPCFTWDVADGFQALAGATHRSRTARRPADRPRADRQGDGDRLYVLKDFHEAWTNPQVKRKLRSVAQRLKFTRKSHPRDLPDARSIPDELKDEAVVIDFAPPDARRARGRARPHARRRPACKVNLTPLGREKLVQAALGLTVDQAQRVFAKAIVARRRARRPRHRPRHRGEEADHPRERGAGVLRGHRDGRRRRRPRRAQGMAAPARAGLHPGGPRVRSAGAQGHRAHRHPRHRQEPDGQDDRRPVAPAAAAPRRRGAVRQPGRRVRGARRAAPCASPRPSRPASSGSTRWRRRSSTARGDSGTSTRVFGTILTWMQEKTAPCFVVATANDIARLPPELLRKGRFDEIFFLDLPTAEEREEILAVHLRKREPPAADFDVDALGRATQGYVGAEIEQAIIDAMYVGFNAAPRVHDRRHPRTPRTPGAAVRLAARNHRGAARLAARGPRAVGLLRGDRGGARRRFVPLQIGSVDLS